MTKRFDALFQIPMKLTRYCFPFYIVNEAIINNILEIHGLCKNKKDDGWWMMSVGVITKFIPEICVLKALKTSDNYIN